MNYSQEENKKKRKEHGSKRKRVKNKAVLLTFRIVLAVALIGMFAVGGVMAGAFFGLIENAPKLEVKKMVPNIYTSVIYEGNTGVEIGRLSGEQNRKYATLDKMPEHLKNAFVAIEDERFYGHNGIDMRGLARIVVVNLTTDRREGASTITQQLIKNNVMKIMRNTWQTKVQEWYLAIEYEKLLEAEYHSKQEAKNQILELYLNTIALGHGLNGVRTAAEYYFGKDVSELTLSESAVIASITNSPQKYSPILQPENNRSRQLLVLRNMLKLNMITQKEMDDALADNVYERLNESQIVISEQNSFNSYFTDTLISEISKDLQDKFKISSEEAIYRIYNDGLQIFSTVDSEMQGIVEKHMQDDKLFSQTDFELDVLYIVSYKNKVTGKLTNAEKKGVVKKYSEVDALVAKLKSELLGPNDEVIAERVVKIPQPNAAFVITDYHTGEVKAIVGGRGEKALDRSLNRAKNSTRQPGSVFKVLASYTAALDLGLITPATVIDDVPYAYGEKQFKNWYTTGYRGLNTVRLGIQDSMNILAVKNLVDTGIEQSFNYLKNMGFTTLVDRKTINGRVFTDKTPALALGGLTNGVTQLELTAAFGMIANGGEYLEPIFYTKVLDHNGVTLLEKKREPKPVIKATTAYLLTNMMQDVVTSGTGGKARFQKSKMPVAGKTGTTTDNHDLTFAGFTPYYAAGVWYGYDQSKNIRDDKGYHLTLWRTIMEEIHINKGLEVKQFVKPSGIVSAQVCRDSGKLPVEGLCDADPRGSRIYSEIFAADTVPEEYCDVHAAVDIDSVTRMKLSPFCPADSKEHLVGIVRPEPRPDDTPTADSKYEIAAIIEGPQCTEHSLPTLPTLPGSWPDIGLPVDSSGNIVLPSYNPTVNPPHAQNPTATPGTTVTPLPSSITLTPPPSGGQTQPSGQTQPPATHQPAGSTPTPAGSTPTPADKLPDINQSFTITPRPLAELPVRDEPLSLDNFAR